MLSMPKVPVRLRPIEEGDLDALRRFDIDPSSRVPTSAPASVTRRPAGASGRKTAGSAPTPASSACSPMGPWPGSASLAQYPDRWAGGRLPGDRRPAVPRHRGQGRGTAAQRLLVGYLFAATLANRLQAITNVENIAEQKALERIGFRRRA